MLLKRFSQIVGRSKSGGAGVGGGKWNRPSSVSSSVLGQVERTLSRISNNSRVVRVRDLVLALEPLTRRSRDGPLAPRERDKLRSELLRPLSLLSCNTRISAATQAVQTLGSLGLFEEVQALHQRFKMARVPFDGFYYGVLIKALAGRVSIERCEAYFREALDAKVGELAVVYNVMIRAWCDRDRIQEALRVFHAMPADLRNVVTFNTLLDAFSKKRWKLAWILRLMEDSGVEKDLISYACVMRMHISFGEYARAAEMFTEAQKRGLRINHVVCMYAVSAYIRLEDLDAVDRLTQQMRAQYGKLPVVIFNALISGFSATGRTDRAFRLLEEVESVDKMELSTLNIFIRALPDTDRRTAPALIDILGKLALAELPANAITTSTLAEKLVAQGRVEEALELEEVQRRLGIKPVSHFYTQVMTGLRDERRVGDMMRLYRSMKASGVRPDKASMRPLLMALTEAKEWDHLDQLVKDMCVERVRCGKRFFYPITSMLYNHYYDY